MTNIFQQGENYQWNVQIAAQRIWVLNAKFKTANITQKTTVVTQTAFRLVPLLLTVAAIQFARPLKQNKSDS